MEKESKEERFKRVAEKRVQNIINSIRNLSQMNNTKVYEWNDDQLKKIWEAVDREIKKCKMSFDEPQSDLFKF